MSEETPGRAPEAAPESATGTDAGATAPGTGDPEAHPLFPGWGSATHIDDLETGDDQPIERLDQEAHHMLGEVPATAICGNDITSSCLYVSALAAIYAGPLAPLCLLAVAGVLYLFRFIYAEVGSALPLNGGAYNALLNTTTKGKAAVAACLTVLSYMATAVISAVEAMHYGWRIWGGAFVAAAAVGSPAGEHTHHLVVLVTTVALLGLFAFLNVIGIGESAMVAVGIFAFHMLTLTLLVFLCGAAILLDSSLLHANLTLPMASWPTPPGTMGVAGALFFGFAAAMLGVSGFESSANFIEEQKEGVFPKTLRNMWIAVAIFNPLISVLSLGMIGLGEIEGYKEGLLAEMASRAVLAMGGSQGWADIASSWVCVDAVVVLSGAVLTSYVGVTGLVRRMSLDRCLPQFLLNANEWRGTNHWIILGFLALCGSVTFIADADVETLAGVYTLSFLSVMALFAIGNMLLKVVRDKLPRESKAPWSYTVVATVAVLVALVGNTLIDPAYVRIFLVYFASAGAVVGVMMYRVPILLGILYLSRWLGQRTPLVSKRTEAWVQASIDELRERAMVFFASTGDPALLNRAALYAVENENIRRLRVIHCFDEIEDVDTEFASTLAFLDRCYPALRIDFLLVRGPMSPGVVDQLSRRLDVPKNYMFIGTPGDHFPHQLADLGGVRLIM